MSENNEQNSERGHGGDHGHDDDHHVPYFKIYLALLVLFAISVTGPKIGELTGLKIITLVTAFGIALVKARLVVNNFMHLKWEKRIMKWLLTTSLLLMALLVAGVAPDVMNHEGNNWENFAAQAAVERGLGGGEHEGEAEEATEVAVVDPAVFEAQASFGLICSSCHGAAGDGTGAAGVALDPKPADFTDPTFWESRDRDRIITVIREGAAAVGGSPLMAPWGALYDEEQLGLMADYVMSLNPGQ
jgi:caa(3)-type oxidase subunit IV